jgi:hypothetical protein
MKGATGGLPARVTPSRAGKPPVAPDPSGEEVKWEVAELDRCETLRRTAKRLGRSSHRDNSDLLTG